MGKRSARGSVIMPVNYSNYPSDWKQIRERINRRAGNRCEQCDVPNHATILRNAYDPEQYLVLDRDFELIDMAGQRVRLSELPAGYDANRFVRVILTVAHLDHDTTNNTDDNLKLLCQLHHLRHDAKHHAENAATTRRAKRQKANSEAGQMDLFSEGGATP